MSTVQDIIIRILKNLLLIINLMLLILKIVFSSHYFYSAQSSIDLIFSDFAIKVKQTQGSSKEDHCLKKFLELFLRKFTIIPD